MPFFIRGRGKQETKHKKAQSKRVIKRKSKSNGLPEPKHVKKQSNLNDEEITSDEEEEFINRTSKPIDDTPYKLIEEETPQEKKVRLAKQYLEEIRKQKEEEIEDEEELNEAISSKLKEDVLEASGRLQRPVADTLKIPDTDSILFFKSKHHKLSLTCLVVSQNENFIFTASKDASIIKWNMDGTKLGMIQSSHKSKGTQVGHKGAVLALSLSSDGRYLASGDKAGVLYIWDANTLSHLKTFRKHKGAISGLAFRKGTNTLYSASHDRLVMAWDIEEMAFMENLGGHHDAITGIDCLTRESCITSGGRDESVLVYVIPEEKQLKFTASQNSIDGVKLINENVFVTFGQDGSLALWGTLKKKPHFMVRGAHGFDEKSGVAHWLTAVAALVNTDVVATGSVDGYVRLWKIVSNHRKLTPLFAVPVPGVVNGLEFTSSGSHLVVAVGQEHKLGRWFTEKKAKNCLIIIKLNKVS